MFDEHEPRRFDPKAYTAKMNRLYELQNLARHDLQQAIVQIEDILHAAGMATTVASLEPGQLGEAIDALNHCSRDL